MTVVRVGRGGGGGGAAALRRRACRRRFARRARRLGIALPPPAALEAWLERCRAAWQRPGADRHMLTLRHNGDRVGVIYDAQLRCVVTCWWRSRKVVARGRPE